MSIAHFQTSSGSCEITEDEVRITKSRVTSLKRTIERKRKTSFSVVILTVILFFMAWYRTGGSVVRALVGVGIFVVAPAIVIYISVEIFGLIRWKVAKLRHDTPEGGFIFMGNIPRSQIVSVGSSRNGKGGVIAVNFEQNGVRTSGVMRFADDERLKRAKAAFQTAGISIKEA